MTRLKILEQYFILRTSQPATYRRSADGRWERDMGTSWEGIEDDEPLEEAHWQYISFTPPPSPQEKRRARYERWKAKGNTPVPIQAESHSGSR